MRAKLKKIIRSVKTARLYARVGLKNTTPLKIYMMVRYWFLSSVLRKKIPWLVEFSVTYRCQCKCPHCSVGEYLDKASMKDELTGGQIRHVLAQAATLGIPKVDYFGGEPLLRGDIVELVRFGAQKGLYISITTNAWLLTREITRQLKQAGISCINISIDSVSEEKHDGLRGLSGLYKKVLDGVRYCHEEGVVCILSTYVTRGRIKNFGSGETDDSKLTEMINLSKSLKASGLRILFPIISGRWEQDKTKEFSEEEKKIVIDNIDHSFAFIEGAYSVRNGKKVCQSLSGKMFNISPYGDIQLCVTFPDGFGNVKNTPLSELLGKMYSHPVYLKNKDGSCCSTTGLKK